MSDSTFVFSSQPSLHPSTVAAVRELRERFPGTPFLTLGQTVLWDEPVKASFCLITEELEKAGEIAPGVRIVAGVHDTDYFAKLEGLSIRDAPFVVLRHNDGDTRGLWSAAGELSALFGAEIVPSRADLTREGVSFAKAARAYPGGAEAMLNQETDAPLWRAIVHSEPHPLIAADVKLRDIAPALREQLRWGFRHSLRATGCEEEFENEAPCASRDIARRIWSWNDEFLTQNPDGTLSDLYLHLIPKIWALVRGDSPNGDSPNSQNPSADRACNLETTTSLELFRFNAKTASKPRFGFVDHFLNPATRELARRCYNDAVRGSGIYTLDQFGPGALPFDVVIPGKGRGTLRLHEGSVFVETEEPVEICEDCDPQSIAQLAALLQSHFGTEICLVGKAVALISMLSAEYIFVFHEKASSYTKRTQQMNAKMRAAGLEVPLHPMLRLQYAAWDALEEVDATFTLPSHLSHAFGTKRLSAREFAARWKTVISEQDELRTRLKNCRSPRDLMRYLAQNGAPIWREKETAYVAAGGVLQLIQEQARHIEDEIEALHLQAKQETARALDLETAKGAAFRAEIAPLRERIFDLKENAARRLSPVDENDKPRRQTKAERAAQAELEAEETLEIERLRAQILDKQATRSLFDRQIAQHRKQARDFKAQGRELLAARLEIEGGEVARAAREALQRLENEAQLKRFHLVRHAIQVGESLRLTNYRPTAWWLPLVSPDGAWLRRLSETAQSRLEEL